MSSGFTQPWSVRHLLITQRLRHRRDELGLTQKQVVTRLGRLGVPTTNRALSSLEHGSGLDIAKLPELARVLDCTVTYLLGLTDDPHRWDPETAIAAAPTPATARPRIENGQVEERERRVQEARESCILGADVPDRSRRLG